MFEKLVSTFLGRFLLNITVSYPIIIGLYYLNGIEMPPYEFIECCLYALAGTKLVDIFLGL